MDIKFDVNKVLEELANAFNTTVEYIYPLLIKQAMIDGIITLIPLTLGVIGIVITLILLSKSKKNHVSENKYDKWQWDIQGLPYIIALVITGFISCIGLTIFAKTGITALLNPEYHVIKSIIDQIK